MPNPHQTLHAPNLCSTPHNPAQLDGVAIHIAVCMCALALDNHALSQHGYSAWLEPLRAAGADALQVCRTSLPADFRDFKALGQACKEHHLQVIYSTEDSLWNAGYISASLSTRLAEAHALGAQAIKFSLGHYPAVKNAGWPQLLKYLTGETTPLVMLVNDRSLGGGSLGPLQNCLEDAEALGYPLHMSFDIANWRWCGVDQTHAAKCLARFVRHMGCKGVRHLSARSFISTATDLERHQWRELLVEFSHLSTLTIEYPLADTAEPLDDPQTRASKLIERAREQIQTLRALPRQAGLERPE